METADTSPKPNPRTLPKGLVTWAVIDNLSPGKIRHARVGNSPTTLCGHPITGVPSIVVGGLRCASCILGVDRLALPAGKIALDVTGTTLVSDDAWAIALYAADERSKLATFLHDITARVDALYKPPPG